MKWTQSFILYWCTFLSTHIPSTRLLLPNETAPHSALQLQSHCKIFGHDHRWITTPASFPSLILFTLLALLPSLPDSTHTHTLGFHTCTVTAWPTYGKPSREHVLFICYIEPIRRGEVRIITLWHVKTGRLCKDLSRPQCPRPHLQ